MKPYPKSQSTISAKTYREEYLSKTRKKNKYNAKTSSYNGVNYHSKLECTYAQELDFRIDAGEVEKWERQVKLPLKVNGMHITNYFIDFRVVNSDGSITYVEVKGMETDLWRTKWKLLLATRDEILEPGAELIVVK